MKCLRASEDGEWLVGVDDEGGVMVYEVVGKEQELRKRCEVRVNDGMVAEVMVNPSHMLFGVISEKGGCSLFSLFDGGFLRSIAQQGSAFTWGMITYNRLLLLYSAANYVLSLYSLEGELLATKELLCEPREMSAQFDGKAVAITDNRTTTLMWVEDLMCPVSNKHLNAHARCDSRDPDCRGVPPSRAACMRRSTAEPSEASPLRASPRRPSGSSRTPRLRTRAPACSRRRSTAQITARPPRWSSEPSVSATPGRAATWSSDAPRQCA